MLSQFRVDNFKSLVNVSFEPVGLNLLVGRNNAGKTNLCHAMRFLSLTSRMSLQEAAKACTPEPWSMANVYLDKATIDLAIRATLSWDGEPLEFAYNLSLAAPRVGSERRANSSLAVHSETLRVSGGGFRDTPLVENEAGKVKLLQERLFLEDKPGRGPVHYIATTAPTDYTMLFRLYDLETNQRANLFKRYLGGWRYYSFDTERLRDSAAQPLDVELQSDGGNLASVLYALKSSDERVYRKIVQAVRTVEAKLDLMNFQAPDPEHVYMFFEDEKGKRFSARNISDGTLRYLALCTVIILGRQSSGASSAAPIIMIEEPENGIFVGYLKPLIEMIEPSGKEGQFIFTSHAPYFIDLFDGCLEGVWLARSLKSHSLIERPPRDKVAQSLGQYSLGEMHFRGLLQ